MLVAVLHERRRSLDHRPTDRGSLAGTSEAPEAKVEVLVFQRVGQLVRKGVVQLDARLDCRANDDDPVAWEVERAADAVEPAGPRVRPEAALRWQEARDLVELNARPLEASVRLEARGMQASAAALAVRDSATDVREPALTHHDHPRPVVE